MCGQQFSLYSSTCGLARVGALTYMIRPLPAAALSWNLRAALDQQGVLLSGAEVTVHRDPHVLWGELVVLLYCPPCSISVLLRSAWHCTECSLALSNSASGEISYL